MSRKRRKSIGKKMNPIFFVFCEGETEEAYSRFLQQLYRIPIQIKTKVTGQNISDGFINHYRKEIQRGNYSPKDKIYLMYDIDSSEIIDRLKSIKSAILIVSNPCIELWFLLHYRNQTANISTRQCISDLTNLNPNYEKGKLNNQLQIKLKSKISIAVKRAKSKNKFENPSTTIYKFVEILDKYKK